MKTHDKTASDVDSLGLDHLSVVIRRISADDLHGEIVEGPMPFPYAGQRVEELNDRRAEGTLHVIAYR